MSAGAVLDGITTAVGRVHGALVSMIVRRRIGREELRNAAQQLEHAAQDIRSMIKEK
jgi:hypothetical protein